MIDGQTTLTYETEKAKIVLYNVPAKVCEKNHAVMAGSAALDYDDLVQQFYADLIRL
jgi:hypothetical protein